MVILGVRISRQFPVSINESHLQGIKHSPTALRIRKILMIRRDFTHEERIRLYPDKVLHVVEHNLDEAVVVGDVRELRVE